MICDSGHKNLVHKNNLNLCEQFPFCKICYLFCFDDKLVLYYNRD